jgi:hypothetical protein
MTDIYICPGSLEETPPELEHADKDEDARTGTEGCRIVVDGDVTVTVNHRDGSIGPVESPNDNSWRVDGFVG